ncbi:MULTISPECIES: glycosyltransferase family 2 protein [Marinomonas]|uniref:Glycosyltransferase family 2 protein n=1 Tax=Marinomonas arctica TaxID=383750 RepID=A0A7H1J454_9GAMM|nr:MULTISPECIES: glycosyltransferase family 2 protein [Marinomonas]QNT05270.1 glycosyltransferase family 2 protein [Marinomonas arctica]GGN38561.1 putative glycosyltransferase [Marinomonas arctica]
MKSSKPLVCICIPNFNNENTIAETLDSLVSQTYENLIIKVFDNASTDSSMKILNEYARKYHNIHVYKNDKNIGGEANFTKCIENMEGEYSTIFHSDDVYSSTIIEKQVAVLQKNKDIVAVSANAFRLNGDSKECGPLYYDFPKPSDDDLVILKSSQDLIRMVLDYGNIINTPSVMARTEIYRDKIISFNGLDFNTSADLDVWLRMSSFGFFAVIITPLIKYRLSNSSYSFNLKKLRVEKNDYFLVIDSYLKNKDLNFKMTERDCLNYEMQRLLDYFLISTNIMLKGSSVSFFGYQKNYKVNFLFIRFLLKRPVFNFKVYIFFLLVYLAPKRKKILQWLYNLRYGK